MENDELVTWICKRTNEVMEGRIINILTQSAVVKVTNVPLYKMEHYGLLNERTVVKLKRLSKVEKVINE